MNVIYFQQLQFVFVPILVVFKYGLIFFVEHNISLFKDVCSTEGPCEACSESSSCAINSHLSKVKYKAVGELQVMEMETVHPSTRPVQFSLTSVKHSLTQSKRTLLMPIRKLQLNQCVLAHAIMSHHHQPTNTPLSVISVKIQRHCGKTTKDAKFCKAAEHYPEDKTILHPTLDNDNEII